MRIRQGRNCQRTSNMKLLIVVDKLLVGFDAPPCDVLVYRQKDAGSWVVSSDLRVNRLDSEDKDFGYIVDYKISFKNWGTPIKVYASELDNPEHLIIKK